MAKVLVANHVTLDGVMQGPARPEEDTRDGFPHGGWAAARADKVMQAKIGERMTGDRAFLFGRRTYEDFYSVWPQRPDDPISQALTSTTKYVASRTLAEPLPWRNSILLDDAEREVARLRDELSGTLTIFGSGELIRALMGVGLVDEYLLMIHPVILGRGRRLFTGGASAELWLADSDRTDSGVVIVLLQPRTPDPATI